MPPLPPAPLVPLFWNTNVPVMAGFTGCGVQVIVSPDAQYE
jgi:hypothetical protein